MATSQSPKEVIIIGGSLAGLFNGTVLLNLGHKVTILERNPSHQLSSQGAGIAIAPIIPPIVGEIKKLGIISGSPITDFFSKYDNTKTPTHEVSKRVQFLTKDGVLKQSVELPVPIGQTSWDLMYNLARAAFDGSYNEGYVKAMEGASGDGRARYWDGVKVLDISDVDGKEKVKVTYEEGESGEKKVLEGDLVIGADGASSIVRRIFEPESERVYAGYIGLRGTVRESLLSEKTLELLGENVTLFFNKGTQILTYRIPGLNGSLEVGERLANIVWYDNASEEQLQKVLTDTSNTKHKFSLGVGKIRPEIKSEYQKLAADILPLAMSELFQKTEHPFIQAVTDNLATKCVFLNGKVILVGDSVAGCRPHSTAGTTQAAMHALLLEKVFGEGSMSLEDWEKQVMEFAKFAQKTGVEMGTLSQFGDHPMADTKPVTSI